MSVTLVYNEGAFQALAHSREIGMELERHGARIATGIKSLIGVQYPGGPNPAPGPAYRRTGDLQDSVRPTPALADEQSLYVVVFADARHGGHLYATTLAERGYVFVTDAILRAP